jgi:hypothetical protein
MQLEYADEYSAATVGLSHIGEAVLRVLMKLGDSRMERSRAHGACDALMVGAGAAPEHSQLMEHDYATWI